MNENLPKSPGGLFEKKVETKKEEKVMTGKKVSEPKEKEVVDKTLQVLNNVDIIKEKDLQKMIDFVYPEWLDKKKYEEIKYGFLNSLNRLRPYMLDKEKEDEFYKKFTGISVLPGKFQNLYEQLICDLEFVEGKKKFITLHQNMFYKLLHKDLIEKNNARYERNKRTGSIPYWVVKCRYCENLGLIEDEIIPDEIQKMC